MYISHSNPENQTIQSLKEHSENTAKLCREFSIPIMKDFLYAIGLLHDCGKYLISWQKYICGEGTGIPHALCGAKEAKELFGSKGVAMMMQYAIAGHHVGLQDSGNKNDTSDKPTLFGTLNRDTKDFSAYKDELSILLTMQDLDKLNNYISAGCRTKEELAERFAFFTRYCFSCLTDADWLDTEKFFVGKSRHSLEADFEKCLNVLNKEIDSFVCVTPLQKARIRLQQQAYKHISDDSPIYLMNMPTGSGKTLCSIKFALERAIATGKKRIIYIIPYNSIIEQTAETFQSIFGQHAEILRHQSTFSFENNIKGTEQDIITLKQCTENWDAQIVLTTAVQFFESMYNNKRSKLRKLHNMSDSILIFDEAHLMPTKFLQPCLCAIHHITRFLNSEAVFLTATMPNYKQLLDELVAKDISVVNLIADTSDFQYFKKADFEHIGQISKDQLIMRAQEYPTSLIVVNNKVSANELYKKNKLGRCYHLSTYMTAYDRALTIKSIKDSLNSLEEQYPELCNVPEDKRVMVISTSLIEAGVDLDFYAVLREFSGLDNVLQAGGRCNREGKRAGAKVYIYEAEENFGKPLRPEQAAFKAVLNEFDDISSSESISKYYARLFSVKENEVVCNALGKRCIKPEQIPFKSYADDFELIESGTVSVAVVRDNISEKLFEKLKATGHIDARGVQPYTCSIRPKEFDNLLKQGVVEDYDSGIYWLTNKDYYDDYTGIKFSGEDKYF